MSNICEVQDCNKPKVAHGVCDMHRKRLARHGHLKKNRPDDWGTREKHPLYQTWCWMKRMEHKFSVCEDWQDFWNFVSDVGERPSEKHQLRRKDPHGNYSQENCEWREIREDKDKAAYAREWRKNNPDKAKNIELRKMFGITLEDYHIMLETQGGVCAVCKKAESYAGYSLAVDHCHATGKIRGLLCNSCNRAIGLFKDSVDNLKSAIAYLNNI